GFPYLQTGTTPEFGHTDYGDYEGMAADSDGTFYAAWSANRQLGITPQAVYESHAYVTRIVPPN
ncbi:MAG: hypothetical protein ABIP89_19910, partial [Polyangiaceae bacterium]